MNEKKPEYLISFGQSLFAVDAKHESITIFFIVGFWFYLSKLRSKSSIMFACGNDARLCLSIGWSIKVWLKSQSEQWNSVQILTKKDLNRHGQVIIIDRSNSQIGSPNNACIVHSLSSGMYPFMAHFIDVGSFSTWICAAFAVYRNYVIYINARCQFVHCRWRRMFAKICN